MSIFDEIEQRGIKEGIKEEKRNIIIRSWENGIGILMISNITNASISEIEKVVADYQEPTIA